MSSSGAGTCLAWFLVLTILLGGCATNAPRCDEVSATREPLAYGSGERVTFRKAIYHSGYHEDVIGPADLLTDEVIVGETPIRATVALAADCRSSGWLADRLRTNGVYIISGSGAYVPMYTGFVVDCLCSVERVEDPTQEQLDRLWVP